MRLVGIPVRALISTQNAAVMARGRNELMDWISTHTLGSEAIAQVQPYGVDVNSGVKGNDGFKNLQRLQAFIRSARSGTSS